MTMRAGHNRRRSLGVGLALFGLFFQLFLPISLAAAAGTGVPNKVLEICAADGFVRVPLPAGEEAGADEGAAAYVEACNHCVLHAAHFFLPTRGAEPVSHARTAGETITFPVTDDIRETAHRAGFDARGPPIQAQFQPLS